MQSLIIFLFIIKKVLLLLDGSDFSTTASPLNICDPELLPLLYKYSFEIFIPSLPFLYQISLSFIRFV